MSKKPARINSIDTFRGFALCIMITANYGGGGYWFLDHSRYDSRTVELRSTMPVQPWAPVSPDLVIGIVMSGGMASLSRTWCSHGTAGTGVLLYFDFDSVSRPVGWSFDITTAILIVRVMHVCSSAPP